MNRLPTPKRVQMYALMVEGMSLRSISRVCDVSFNTVLKFMKEAGEATLDMHDQLVVGVNAKRVQCDEIWAFNYCKQKNVATAKAAPLDAGDIWSWTALDSDSKLMLSYVVAGRTIDAAKVFMHDLARRLTGRIQLTTDGWGAYPDAVEMAFGADVDYARLIKNYADAYAGPEHKYSPSKFVSAHKLPVTGEPDMAKVSTSHIERSNLTMRTSMRRFTRLSSGHSKKYANHLYSHAIFFMYYNFARQHKAHKLSPAMAAGIETRLWTIEDIVARMDAVAPKSAPRGPYKKRT
jgi:IS1 family transposase